MNKFNSTVINMHGLSAFLEKTLLFGDVTISMIHYISQDYNASLKNAGSFLDKQMVERIS